MLLHMFKVPDSLKSMIEGLRRMEDAGEDELDVARPRSGAARQPKEEFPRPLSQVAPLPPLPPHLSSAARLGHPSQRDQHLLRVPPGSHTLMSLSGSWPRWRMSWIMR